MVGCCHAFMLTTLVKPCTLLPSVVRCRSKELKPNLKLICCDVKSVANRVLERERRNKAFTAAPDKIEKVSSGTASLDTAKVLLMTASQYCDKCVSYLAASVVLFRGSRSPIFGD